MVDVGSYLMMNLFKFKKNLKFAKGDIQKTPIRFGSHSVVKVDCAVIYGDNIVVAGWCNSIDSLTLRLFQGNEIIQSKIFNFVREDVNNALSLDFNKKTGFLIFSNSNQSTELKIKFGDLNKEAIAECDLIFNVVESIESFDKNIFGEYFEFLEQMNLENKNKGAFKDCVDEKSISLEADNFALGHIDDARFLSSGHAGYISGWFLVNGDNNIYIEKKCGDIQPLESIFWVSRPDVINSVGAGRSGLSPNPGFIAYFSGVKPGEQIKLLYKNSDNSYKILHQKAVGDLPSDPVKAAQILFGLPTPITSIAKRFSLIDHKILDPLVLEVNSSWESLPCEVKSVGKVNDNPLVSIIVPLYGRTDFVEHQILEFARDKWLLDNSEIIYVIDSPDLVEHFIFQSMALYRTYKIPFKWIFGGVNRGFAGACNLGAIHSKGKYLNFLNSDAFPNSKGWLDSLVQVLEENPEVGVVVPRLVFADGSIQHAGMEFLYRDELGIWTNHHPFAGVAPEFDPHEDLVMLPCVTGACMLFRSADFFEIGQWDTGYLVGDYEDSDICLKIRSLGKNAAYYPKVELTHLERQSFKLIGEDIFKLKLMIFNAVRHQNKWSKIIEANPTSIY